MLAQHIDTCLDCLRTWEALSAAPSVHSAETRPAPMVALSENEPRLEPADRPEHLGRLGHYQILAKIGRGGMGIVYKAFDPKLDRVVAIKVLAPSFADEPTAHQRFLREARTAAAVTHENIVTIHVVDESNGSPYLVMHYVPGMSLQERLRRSGSLSVKEIVRIGQEAAKGLAAAHRHGLIHRDIKPGNILLEEPDGRVKITDFGLARAINDASITNSGCVAGTPQFMAPEQTRGETLDGRADLFSLGSVLYTLCEGRPPFQADSAYAVLKKVSDEEAPPIRNPHVPADLLVIIARLHAKKPADRFQSAQEVADQLGKLLTTLPDLPEEPTADWQLTKNNLTAVPRQGATEIAQAKETMFAPLAAKRGRFWLAAAGVLVILVIAGIAFLPSLYRSWFPAVVPDRSPPGPQGGSGAPARAVAPFNAAEAKAHQDAWAKHLGVDVEIKNEVGMTLRLIPPGEFTMGSTLEEVNAVLPTTPPWNRPNVQTEAPPRRVPIDHAYYMGIHEVTVGQYERFVKDARFQTWAERPGNGGRSWDSKQRAMVRKPGFNWTSSFVASSKDLPVVLLHRDDVHAFCAWLGKKDGRRYELPTDEQWEYACRAGTTTRWFWGDEEARATQYGWFGDKANLSRQMEVGQKLPNAFGLHDMAGNVAESARDAKGVLVMRGGHAGYAPLQTRSAAREYENHTDPTYRNGFRVVASIDVRKD